MKTRLAKVFIIDDYPTIAEFLRILIGWQPDLEVCGDALTALAALSFLSVCLPDLVLLDLGLPDRHGLELLKDIHLLYPNLRVLVLSAHDELLFADRALRAGACGYVMKNETSKIWLEAMRLVIAGGIYLSPAIMSRRKQQAVDSRSISKVKELSDREMEVLQLLGQGYSVGQISTILSLGRHTVETYQTRIKSKLRLNSTHELIRYAVSWSITSGVSIV